MPEALKSVVGALLGFLKELFVGLGIQEAVTAIEDILANFAE